MSGFVGNLSVKQEDSLRRFKTAIVDIWLPEFDSDAYLLRWLRARNFDVKKANHMLRNHIVWRQRENIDTILSEYHCPEVISKYYPGGFMGHTKDGYPLRIDPIGHIDPKGLFQSATKHDLLRSRIQILEWVHEVLLPKRIAEEGRPIDGIVIIFDMIHFGMKHLWKPALDGFIEITKMCEANYPETMYKCFVVNAPAIFPIAYNLIKPFLHELTQRKIVILGSNFRDELLTYFDADQLPVQYGGTRTDPDGNPKCCSSICWGGEVPESFYLKSNKETMTIAHVPRGSGMEIEFTVDVKNSYLQWEFVTDDHDIKFSIYRKTGPGKQSLKEMVLVRDTQRVACHLAREKGEMLCAAPGCYVLHFDNGFSWARSKRLWYRVDILDGFCIGQNEYVALDDMEGKDLAASMESFHSACSHISS